MIQLSTGDMLREAKDSGTEMGKNVAEVMARGDLVTDEIVIGLIREKLRRRRRAASSLTASRAPWRRPMRWPICWHEQGETLDAVIEMQVDDDALVDRITARSTCAAAARSTTTSPSRSRRMANAPTAAAASSSAAPTTTRTACASRLMEYYKKTSPLIGYYYAKDMLSSVEWTGRIDEVDGSDRGHSDANVRCAAAVGRAVGGLTPPANPPNQHHPARESILSGSCPNGIDHLNQLRPGRQRLGPAL